MIYLYSKQNGPLYTNNIIKHVYNCLHHILIHNITITYTLLNENYYQLHQEQ